MAFLRIDFSLKCVLAFNRPLQQFFFFFFLPVGLGAVGIKRKLSIKIKTGGHSSPFRFPRA